MLLSAASVPRAPRNQEILSNQPPACSREAAENEKSDWYLAAGMTLIMYDPTCIEITTASLQSI